MKPPLVSARECIKALGKVGFIVDRQKGSHIILTRHDEQGSKSVIVPERREIPRGTLRNIIDQAGLTLEAFVALLD